MSRPAAAEAPRPPVGTGTGTTGTGVTGTGVTGTGTTVTGLVLRVVLVGAALLGAAAQLDARDGVLGLLVPVALAVLAALRPGSPLTALTVLALFAVAAADGPALDLRDAASLLAVHLVHVTAGLAACVPASARLELAALRPAMRRFVLVQGLSQVVLALAVAASLAW